MIDFQPDYGNAVLAATNKEAPRLPLYEHTMANSIIEDVLNVSLEGLLQEGHAGKKEYFRLYCEFFRRMGYDIVPFEVCLGSALPGSGCLGNHAKSTIEDRSDFEKYPWDEVHALYFKLADDQFKALGEALPPGMKAVGGVGNGVFEAVQDIIGYESLAYIKADDEKLYADLFKAMGELSFSIWKTFLERHADTYCIARFGDDLGFKSATLLSPEDIRKHIIPQYKRIISLIHSYSKPFLLHSCGKIFDVMEDLIAAGIDAKHSNEDQIAPFPVWIEKYGDRIGNFGGVDTDAVCRMEKAELKSYILDILGKSTGHGGFAFSSGNSIPSYVPTANYLNMIEIVREYRGA
jgi:uroporphyrinogen decarboxylase